MGRLVVYLCFLSTTLLKFASCEESYLPYTPMNFRNENIAAWFYRYASIKDTIEDPPHNESSLIPLLNLTGTKFSQIVFHIQEHQLSDSNWRAIAPIAVARLNQQMSTSNYSQPYLRVWIPFHYNTVRRLDNQTIEGHLMRLLEICKHANTIFPNTIHSLSVHLEDKAEDPAGLEIVLGIVRFWRTRMNLQPDIYNFKLGVMYYINKCQLPQSQIFMYMKRISQYTDLVFFDVLTLPRTAPETTISTIQTISRLCQTVLERMYEKRPFELGFLTGWPDINGGYSNFTNLVTFWRLVAEQGRNTGTTFLMTLAFDDPTEYMVAQETVGWWRLKENYKYRSTAEYEFEAKEMLAWQEQVNASRISNYWLSANVNFSKEFVGISINHEILQCALNLENISIQNSFQEISQTFSRILYKFDSDNLKNERMLSNAAEMNKNLTKSGLKFVILTSQTREMALKPQLEVVKRVNAIRNKTIDTLLLTTEVTSISPSLTLLQNVQHGLALDYIGLALPLYSWCLKTKNLSLDNVTNSIGIRADINWVKLAAEADRFLSQFIVLLETCKERLLQIKHIEKIFFVVDWTEIDLENVVLIKLINFVKFWEGLNQWAVESGNATVIIGQAFDSVSDTGVTQNDGWWTILQTNRTNIEQFTFLDKKSLVRKLYEEESQKHDMENPTSYSVLQIVIFSVVALIVVLLIITILAYIRKQNNLYQVLSKREVHSFFDGGVSSENKGANLDKTVNILHGTKYDRLRYEISEDKFKIELNEKGLLGQGEFGTVYAGTVLQTNVEVSVAVKMTKQPPTHIGLLGLLSEIKALSYLGKHENIVELVGAYTSQLPKGVVYLFLELCSLGSLQKNLQMMALAEKHKDNIIDMLHNWSVQIANGMKYLASKHVVHGDLATRNVLLTANNVAKIADFGLSRRVYNYECYKKSGREPLPWRWMAPESLKYLEFTEKSDVWAFGITLWEIHSFGNTPYANIPWSTSFVYKLNEGFRLSIPEHCMPNERVASLMKQCWDLEPSRRLNFCEILDFLQSEVQSFNC